MADFIIGEKLIIKNMISKKEYDIDPGSFNIEKGFYQFKEIDPKTNAFIFHYGKIGYFKKIIIEPIWSNK